jgi:hypothetical protein
MQLYNDKANKSYCSNDDPIIISVAVPTSDDEKPTWLKEVVETLREAQVQLRNREDVNYEVTILCAEEFEFVIGVEKRDKPVELPLPSPEEKEELKQDVSEEDPLVSESPPIFRNTDD